MDQSISPQTIIAENVRALRNAQARTAETNSALTEISNALQKGRALIAGHTMAEQQVAALREKRSQLMADSLTGNGDSAAMAANARDLKAAEARLMETAADAEAAKAAIVELESRYTAAQKPLLDLGKKIPELNVTLLDKAAENLMALYAELVCTAYDAYTELCVLVQSRNVHARAAGIAPLPEAILAMQFPGLPVGPWRLENSIVATKGEQFERARNRLATKLADMGIPG